MQDDKTYTTRLNTPLTPQVACKAVRIEVFFQAKLFVIEQAEMPYFIGRDEASCDMVIANSTISRRHCAFEVRGSQIGVLDDSTNGTYVQSGRADTLKIHKEFFPLVGTGTLMLGHPADDNPEVILYKIITV